MTAEITAFMANLQHGGFRPNRYKVILTFPPGVVNATMAAIKTGFTCSAASIPQLTEGVAEVAYMGRILKLPGDRTWDDWTITVYVDNDFVQRDAFESWHENMLGLSSNVAAPGYASPGGAFASARVQALDRYDNVTREWELEAIWPTNVGEITLGYDQNDQVATMQVTFAVNGMRSAVSG